MKKILFVANVYRHLTSFHIPYMKAMMSKGYKVYAASQEDYGDKKLILENEGIECLDVSFNRKPLTKDNIKAYKSLKRLIDQYEFDLIIVNTPIASLITRLAFDNRKNKNIGKLVYTVHGFHFHSQSSKKDWMIYYPLEKYFANKTDLLITTNEEDFKLVNNKNFSTDITKINGVGVEVMEPINEHEKNELKKELGIEPGQVVLFTAAEFNDNKNQQFILKNWREIKEKCPQAVLLFAGEGEKKKDLEEFVNVNNLKDVKFLGYRTDVSNIIQVIDIFFLLSKREGLPKSLMEAMIAEKPSVVTAIRGNRDLISDNVEGYLVELGNNHLLVNDFVNLIKDETLREQMGHKARKKVKAFELDTVLQEYEQQFDRLLSGK